MAKIEYQKIINLLDNMNNQPSESKKRNWLEVGDDACRTYAPNIQIRFKTTMLNSSLYDYSDAYILVKGTIYWSRIGWKNKQVTLGGTPAVVNTKDIQVALSLKYLTYFCRTLEATLINCKINLLLTWWANCVFTNSTDAGTFLITDVKLYVPVVTLSIQEKFENTTAIESRIQANH